MRPSQIKEAVKTLVQIRQPVFLWGSPGIGKSDVVRQVADELYGKDEKIDRFKRRDYFVDIRALLLDPVDLRGIPNINGDGQAHWCPPEFLPRTGKGILFLDELPAAPPLVQAALYQLVLDRRIGEYFLPDGWAVVAAGNREIDKAVTHRMPSPLANRFVHLTYEVLLEDFVAWAWANGVEPEVISFLKFRGIKLLNGFDPKKNEKAFPTPRAWEFVSRIIKAKPSNEFEIIMGTVGEGAASEFVGWLKTYRELPDPKKVLAEPTKAKVPTEPSILYALCGALANLADHKDKLCENLFVFANRLTVEFGVMLVRDSVQKDRKLLHTKGFVEWAAKHQDVLV